MFAEEQRTRTCLGVLPERKAMSMDRSRRFVSAGHPWAALVAFDAALCAAMLNFQYVAVGNEASADAGNGIFLTKEMVDGQVSRGMSAV